MPEEESGRLTLPDGRFALHLAIADTALRRAVRQQIEATGMWDTTPCIFEDLSPGLSAAPPADTPCPPDWATCVLYDARGPEDWAGLRALLVRTRRPVVVIASSPEPREVVAAIKGGAIDVLLHPLNTDDLLRSLDEAAREARRRLDAQERRDRLRERWASLSVREQAIARLLERDLSNADIARRLGVSERTVKSYRATLMDKLQVRSLAGMLQALIALDRDGTVARTGPATAAGPPASADAREHAACAAEHLGGPGTAG